MGKSIHVNYLEASPGQETAHVLRYYIAKGFLEPEDTVIELGCGSGYGAYMLSKVGCSIHAFDIENSFAEPYRKIPNIKFEQADLRGRALPEADVIVAMEFIEHTENPGEIVCEIKKKAKRFIILSYPQKPTAGLDPTHKSNLVPNKVKAWIEDEKWYCFFEHSFGLSLIQVYKYYPKGWKR